MARDPITGSPDPRSNRSHQEAHSEYMWSALPSTAAVGADIPDRQGWAMCGRLRVGKDFLHVLQHWSVQPCVRPVQRLRQAARLTVLSQFHMRAAPTHQKIHDLQQNIFLLIQN